MKVNVILNSISNLDFAGKKNRSVVNRGFISDKTARNLSEILLNHEYDAAMLSIKNSKKIIPLDTIKSEVSSKVRAIKYPGSYRMPCPGRKLLSLLFHVKSEQPNDFNAVLEYLVQSISEAH